MSSAATLPHTSLNNGGGGAAVGGGASAPPQLPSVSAGGGYRTRKLSNSSMASDVSFRLPTYEQPSIYHLQSDMESASEFEDSQLSSASASTNAAANAQLDQITKQQLHQAYMKAMEKYQKYRSRYTDVAKRYRDLERDNNKARVRQIYN